MTVLVLLDTNAYLRFAKRFRPLVGRRFGQKDYELTILKAVEDEVLKSRNLKFLNPWFQDEELAEERRAKQVRLSPDKKSEIKAMQSILRAHVIENISRFNFDRRSPPGDIDCWLLAYAQVENAIVVTDDLGMHTLAADFELATWHGFELLDKLRSAKQVDAVFIQEIYTALETNQDLTKTWIDAKYTTFNRVFGNKPD